VFHLEQPTLNSALRNEIKESISNIVSQIATLNETKTVQIYNEFELSDFLISNEKFLIKPRGHSYEVPMYVLDEEQRRLWDHQNTKDTGWKYGEIGVWASNYLALKSFVESNFEYAIYFEDDFEIKEGFIDLLQNCFSELPEDWDVLYPYSHELEEVWYEIMEDRVDIGKRYISKTWHELSQACYLINKKGAKKILDYVEKETISKFSNELKI
jgi:GR25 family glycosyltransferase involved in LPS biosynthesis